jgi:hypothetical protein
MRVKTVFFYFDFFENHLKRNVKIDEFWKILKVILADYSKRIRRYLKVFIRKDKEERKTIIIRIDRICENYILFWMKIEI